MNFVQNSMISIACGVARRLFIIGGRGFFCENVDAESNGHVMKKQLRCAISTCFDKGSICCKVCDIKNCRYKCNFIDKVVCENQYWE